jgi:hypothetical protein
LGAVLKQGVWDIFPGLIVSKAEIDMGTRQAINMELRAGKLTWYLFTAILI